MKKLAIDTQESRLTDKVGIREQRAHDVDLGTLTGGYADMNLCQQHTQFSHELTCTSDFDIQIKIEIFISQTLK